MFRKKRCNQNGSLSFHTFRKYFPLAFRIISGLLTAERRSGKGAPPRSAVPGLAPQNQFLAGSAAEWHSSDQAAQANRSFPKVASRSRPQVRPAFLFPRRPIFPEYIVVEMFESVRSWLQSCSSSSDFEIAVRSNLPLGLRGNLSRKWNLRGTIYSGSSDRT